MPAKPFNELTQLGRKRRLYSLAKAALAKYGLEDAHIEPEYYGVNATFRVEANESRKYQKAGSPYIPNRYLLKVHDPNYQTSVFISSELEWLRALRQDTNLAVPEPVANLNGELLTEVSTSGIPEPRVCSLTHWMDGRLYRRLRPHHIRAIGEIMAKLHNHTEGWSPPQGFTRRRLDWDGLLGDDTGLAISPQEVWKSLPPRYAELFEAVSEKLRQAMRELGDGPDAFGLIHADLHKHNILFWGKEARAIDFDDSGFGYRVYDFAVSLLENDALDMHDELFAGYAIHRKAPTDQLQYLDTFVAARRISNATWVFGKAKEDPNLQINASRWLESTAQSFRQLLEV